MAEHNILPTWLSRYDAARTFNGRHGEATGQAGAVAVTGTAAKGIAQDGRSKALGRSFLRVSREGGGEVGGWGGTIACSSAPSDRNSRKHYFSVSLPRYACLARSAIQSRVNELQDRISSSVTYTEMPPIETKYSALSGLSTGPVSTGGGSPLSRPSYSSVGQTLDYSSARAPFRPSDSTSRRRKKRPLFPRSKLWGFDAEIASGRAGIEDGFEFEFDVDGMAYEGKEQSLSALRDGKRSRKQTSIGRSGKRMTSVPLTKEAREIVARARQARNHALHRANSTQREETGEARFAATLPEVYGGEYGGDSESSDESDFEDALIEVSVELKKDVMDKVKASASSYVPPAPPGKTLKARALNVRNATFFKRYRGICDAEDKRRPSFGLGGGTAGGRDGSDSGSGKGEDEVGQEGGQRERSEHENNVGEKERDPNADDAYLLKCLSSSLVPEPLAGLDSSSTELNLANFELGDEYAEALSKKLRASSTFKRIDLRENRLTETGAKVIFESLWANTQLETLCFSHNRIGRIGMESLCSFVDILPLLVEIDLSSNMLNKEVKILCAAFAKPECTVKRLILDNNAITDSSCVFIKEMLVRNGDLEELSLSFNKVRADGVVTLMEGLRENSSLAVLDLSWNAIGSPRAHHAMHAIGEVRFARCLCERVRLPLPRFEALL